MVMVSQERAMAEQERGFVAGEWPPERVGQSVSRASAGRLGDGSLNGDAATVGEAASVPDEQLMLAFCGGDEAAFETLFLRYKQPIFGFFRRRLTDQTRAEELTQECFLALLRAGERYKQQAAFRTFLYAIALNLLRADRRKTTFRALWSGNPPETEAADAQADAEAGVLMRDVLSRLEPHDHEVLMLRSYEDLSYAEIAELLQMPVNTVRSRLFRARAALRDLLSSPRPGQQRGAAFENAQGKEQA